MDSVAHGDTSEDTLDTDIILPHPHSRIGTTIGIRIDQDISDDTIIIGSILKVNDIIADIDINSDIRLIP
ncbi:MAG: hypothetical protein NPIRA05_18610 [Nitrospirales bacterium]|nr:MAG: hypothetical protein NPIRA05_18610 [Nitrospirales bacterium]